MSIKKNSGVDKGIWKVKEEFTRRDLLNYDPVGLPDQADAENIRTLLRNHEQVHPGEVRAHAEYNRKLSMEATLDPFHNGFQNKDSSRRHTLGMPTCVLREIEESYPLMFTNLKHLAWFKKMFPMFTVAKL